MPAPSSRIIRKQILDRLSDLITTKVERGEMSVMQGYRMYEDVYKETARMSDESLRYLLGTRLHVGEYPQASGAYFPSRFPGKPPLEKPSRPGEERLAAINLEPLPPKFTETPYSISTFSHEAQHHFNRTKAALKALKVTVPREALDIIETKWGFEPIAKMLPRNVQETIKAGTIFGQYRDEYISSIAEVIAAKRLSKPATPETERLYDIAVKKNPDLVKRIIETLGIAGATATGVGLMGESKAEAMPLGPVQTGAKAILSTIATEQSTVAKRYIGSNVMGKELRNVWKDNSDPSKRYLEFADDTFVPISRSEAQSLSIGLGHQREMGVFETMTPPEKTIKATKSFESRERAATFTGGDVSKFKAQSRMEQIVNEAIGLDAPGPDDVLLYNAAKGQTIPLPRLYYEYLKESNPEIKLWEALGEKTAITPPKIQLYGSEEELLRSSFGAGPTQLPPKRPPFTGGPGPLPRLYYEATQEE